MREWVRRDRAETRWSKGGIMSRSLGILSVALWASLTTAAHAAVVITYTYDDLNRVTSAAWSKPNVSGSPFITGLPRPATCRGSKAPFSTPARMTRP